MAHPLEAQTNGQPAAVNLLILKSDPERERRYVGKYSMGPNNPQWLLMELFIEQGYPLRLSHPDGMTPRFTMSHLLYSGDPERDYAELRRESRRDYGNTFITCEDPVRNQRLKQIERFVHESPEFKFFDLAYRGRDVDVLERVVAGQVTRRDVQRAIPNAQDMQLIDDDKRQTLALAYEIRAHDANEDMKSRQRWIPSSEEDEDTKQKGIDELSKEILDINRKLRGLAVPPRVYGNLYPIPPDRVKDVLRGLAEKAEQTLDHAQ